MNLKIKLENSKYCNGCPCFINLNNSKMPLKKYCNFYDSYDFTYTKIGATFKGHWYFIRPKKCIKENGE